MIVPYCYVKIYFKRKNQKVPGLNKEKETLRRRKRNAVTFKYNMIIWLMELCSVLVSINMNCSNK